MGVLKTDDINPDGVRIVIDWPSMVISSSVFVPCINTQLAKQQIQVNKEEAKGNWFQSSWRPLIGWICGLSLMMNYMKRQEKLKILLLKKL